MPTGDNVLQQSRRNPEVSDIGNLAEFGRVLSMAPDAAKVLALADERVARSRAYLHTQREILETFRRLGHDTSHASALLREYEEVQGRIIAFRDQLREELEHAA